MLNGGSQAQEDSDGIQLFDIVLILLLLLIVFDVFLSHTFTALGTLGAVVLEEMSKDNDHSREPSPWAGSQHPSHTPPPSGHSTDPGSPKLQNFQPQFATQYRPSSLTPSSNIVRPLDRPKLPTRSSTIGSSEPDRNLSVNTYIPHSRSEDLNHGSSSSSHPSGFPGSSPRPSLAFLPSAGGSSNSTPAGSQRPNHPSSSEHSDESERPMSVASFSSAHSGDSSHSGVTKPTPPTASSTSANLSLT